MDFLISILLGVVQGLSEFFPVSSTGHLVILERLSGFSAPALTFHVFVHMGTWLAVLLSFRKDIRRLRKAAFGLIADVRSFRKAAKAAGGQQPDVPPKPAVTRTNYRHLVLMLLAALLTVVLMGLALDRFVWQVSYSLFGTGVGFLISGIVLMVTDRVAPGETVPRDLPVAYAIPIGLAAGCALFPGISVTGVVICACIFSGMNRKNAIRFAYLLQTAVVPAAFVYELADSIRAGILTPHAIGLCLLGFLFAALTGILVIGRLLRRMQRARFQNTAWYCLMIGLAGILLAHV